MVEPIINTHFSLGTELSALEELEAGLHTFSERAQLTKRDHYQIRLVLDELVTNSVSYGFVSGVGSGIDIDITLHSDGLCEIVYSDNAPPFDILANPVPPEIRSTKEANYGGFGISLITQMMNEVTYCYEGGKNIVRMNKKLTTDAE